MCWLALCWLLGGCYDGNGNGNGNDNRKHDRISTSTRITTTTSDNPNALSTSASNYYLPFGANAGTKYKPEVDYYPWPKPQTYNTRWDKVNVDHMLASKRLLTHYYNCLISKGPCPPDGLEIKREWCFTLCGHLFALLCFALLYAFIIFVHLFVV